MTMLPFSVSGEDATWTVFERRSNDDWPLIVNSRLSDNELVDFATANEMVVVMRQYMGDNVNAWGMPQIGDALYEWDDLLVGEIKTRNIPAVLLATVTGEGARDMYFAIGKDANITPAVHALPQIDGQMGVMSCDDKVTTFALIAPTDVDQRLSAAEQIFDVLKKHGDDGSQARHTQFWFYGEQSALEKLVPLMAAEGLQLDEWTENRDGVILGDNIAPNRDVFADLTPRLLAAAKAAGVTYDGWETGPSPSPEVPSLPEKKSLFGKLFGG